MSSRFRNSSSPRLRWRCSPAATGSARLRGKPLGETVPGWLKSRHDLPGDAAPAARPRAARLREQCLRASRRASSCTPG